jgi:hypothetical protein
MRLNYVPDPPTDLTEEEQAVLERVKARRGKLGLLPLDLTLLHSPNVTDGKYDPTSRNPKHTPFPLQTSKTPPN